MNEPWLAKQDDERPVPSVYTFNIFCEDEVSEPEYFKSFQKNRLKINAFKGQKSKKASIDSAIHDCIETGLLKYIDGKLTPMFEEGFQVWCVFDRDKNVESKNHKQADIAFHTSIDLANNYSINVAWSNDAFELWVLLHFEEIDTTKSDYEHRDHYYAKLDTYFRGVENPDEKLKRHLLHPTFSYKKDIKNNKLFTSVALPILEQNTSTAIERAKKLEALHTDKPFHERVPCTTVHHLVLELLDKSK